MECCIWGGRGEEEVEAMKVIGKATKRIVNVDLEFDVEQEGILRERSRRKKLFQERFVGPKLVLRKSWEAKVNFWIHSREEHLQIKSHD